MKSSTVKTRIFVTNTVMVLVTLLLFLIVNLIVLNLFEIFTGEDENTSVALTDNVLTAQRKLESFTIQDDPNAYATLAQSLHEDGFDLSVLAEDKIVYTYDKRIPNSILREFRGHSGPQGNISGGKGRFPSIKNDSAQPLITPEILTASDASDDTVQIYAQNRFLVLSKHLSQENVTLFAFSGDTERFLNRKKQADRFWPVFLIDSIVGILILLGISQFFTRRLTGKILHPLNELTAAAGRMKAGDFTTPISYHGDSEFEQVCDAFNDMQVQVRQAKENREKEETARKNLIIGISHDLRTPLTAIRGTIKGLIDNIARTPAEREKFLDTAYRRTIEMDTLLEKLVEIQRIQSDTLRFECVKTDLREFCAQYIERKSTELNSVSGSKQLRLRLEADTGSYNTTVDHAQLHRIFDNLIENTQKYAETEAPEVRFILRHDNDGVHCTVADNGRGIEADKLPFVFDRFYRGDESRHDRSGNGLGLYIVQHLVEAMGGTVRALNDNGFAVELCFPMGNENPERTKETEKQS